MLRFEVRKSYYFKAMNLTQMVQLMKDESDLNNFFDTTAKSYCQSQVLPSLNEAQKIKVALALSDQKEGQNSKSNAPLYQEAYQIAQAI
jgi:hypothetical protein